MYPEASRHTPRSAQRSGDGSQLLRRMPPLRIPNLGDDEAGGLELRWPRRVDNQVVAWHACNTAGANRSETELRGYPGARAPARQVPMVCPPRNEPTRFIEPR